MSRKMESKKMQRLDIPEEAGRMLGWIAGPTGETPQVAVVG